MIKKICKRCGEQYIGTAHSWYCPSCKKEVLNERRKKDVKKIKSRQIKNTCVICGKIFTSYQKKETCGSECEKKLRSSLRQGYRMGEDEKRKIAEKNCIAWHLVSPEGVHYRFENLRKWARENCELFGFEKSEKNMQKIATGIVQAKKGKIVSTYKDWSVIDDPSEYGPKEIIKLYKNGISINRIHEMTGKSASKIRKLLITEGLWSDKLSEKISELKRQGKTEDEISELLNVSKKIINSRTPYSKCMYEWYPSDNALRIRKCRENKRMKE